MSPSDSHVVAGRRVVQLHEREKRADLGLAREAASWSCVVSRIASSDEIDAHESARRSSRGSPR